MPDLAYHKCGPEVCLSVEDSILLSRFFVQVRHVQEALDGCSLVAREHG